MTAVRTTGAAALAATLGLAAVCRVVSVWQMTGTDLDGYFSEGHGVARFLRGTRRQHVRPRGRHRLPLLLQLRPRHGVPMGYYASLDRAPNGRDEYHAQ